MENKYLGSHPTEGQLLLALDGELEQSEAKQISLHVESCAVCRGQWEQWKQLSEQIREHHGRILKAHPLPPMVPRNRANIPAMAALSGVAAALLCLVWLIGRTIPKPTVAHQTTSQQQVVAAATPQVPSATPAAVRRTGSRHRRATMTVPENNSFIALPFSDSALPLGDATVVRVQMAVEQLQSTGLPMLDARPGTSVEADVLVGIDGLPRGIRLVHLVQ